MNVSQSLLAAAFGGMVLGAVTACGGGSKGAPDPAMQNSQAAPSGPSAPSAMPMEAMGDKHGCGGHNECKGQGGCKTDKHACKGQNACKGQGGCKS